MNSNPLTAVLRGRLLRGPRQSSPRLRENGGSCSPASAGPRPQLTRAA
jgi:hypothetical protein